MRHSLEMRVPLLDHRLIEHAFRLPLDAMYRAGTGKQLLREVSRDLLPEAVQNGPQPGFSSPRTQWRERGLGAFEAERLRNGFLLGHGLVRRAAVESLLTRPDLGRNSHCIWLLLVLDLWLEAHFG
jgi:asparagine synthase (glutamine-hydrolysing)